jgi:long-chain fatty acid transport protein
LICASRIAALPAVLVALGTTATHADDNHYQNYLVGERAVGLGGAFTAIADDSSGAFYNPAGLAESPHSSLSLSAAVYGFATHRDAVDALGVEDSGNTFISYPTTAAWIQRVRRGAEDGRGRIQLALSLITPYSTVSRRRLAYAVSPQPTATAGQTVGADVLEVNLADDDTLWIGLSGAAKLHRRISVGLTVFGTLRSGVYQFHGLQLLRFYQADQETDRAALGNRADLHFLHGGLLGVAGAMIAITDRLRLGAAFRTPQLRLSGSGEANLLSIGVAEQRLQVQSTDLAARFFDYQPFKATLGAAYVVPRRIGVSLDFALHGPWATYTVLELEQPAEGGARDLFWMRKKIVWQLNAGAEYYLRGIVPLRLGAFTNLSSLDPVNACDPADPNCAETANPFADAVDRFGLAGSIGYEVDRATLNLGWSYCFGFRTEQRQGVQVSSYSAFLLFVLSGSFRF